MIEKDQCSTTHQDWELHLITWEDWNILIHIKWYKTYLYIITVHGLLETVWSDHNLA